MNFTSSQQIGKRIQEKPDHMKELCRGDVGVWQGWEGRAGNGERSMVRLLRSSECHQQHYQRSPQEQSQSCRMLEGITNGLRRGTRKTWACSLWYCHMRVIHCQLPACCPCIIRQNEVYLCPENLLNCTRMPYRDHLPVLYSE